MKRDIDLVRQLLLDIENRGADCSVSVLRTGPDNETEERIRYHLRLLIDAELLKEIDQTSAGVPCVRLTHEGHELVELTRNEARWRDAKWVCHDHTGGLSLTVIRGLLARWAYGPQEYAPRRRRVAASPYRPIHEYYSTRPAYRVEPYRLDDRQWQHEDDAGYVRVRSEAPSRWRRNGFDIDGDGVPDLQYESSLPDELI